MKQKVETKVLKTKQKGRKKKTTRLLATFFEERNTHTHTQDFNGRGYEIRQEDH